MSLLNGEPRQMNEKKNREKRTKKKTELNAILIILLIQNRYSLVINEEMSSRGADSFSMIFRLKKSNMAKCIVKDRSIKSQTQLKKIALINDFIHFNKFH